MNEEITTKENTQELVGNSPHSLISQALAQGAGIDTLERLMNLQERWEKSQAKKSFLSAMTNFQNELPEIKKPKKVDFPSSRGGNVRYNYAPLPYIIKIIKPILKKNGLSYRWEFEENGVIKCTCILSHIDGHSESSTMQAGKDTSGSKNDIQSIGSTRTYLQRYTLIGVLGLSTAEDDNDGESSTSGKKESIPAPQEKKPAVINDVNWEKLIKSCETTKALTSLWNKMNQSERETHKKTFSDIKGNIEAEKNKNRG